MSRTKRLDLPVADQYGLRWKSIRVPTRVVERFEGRAAVYGPLVLRDEQPETQTITIPVVIGGRVIGRQVSVPYGAVSDRTIIRIVRVWLGIAKSRLAESRKRYGGAWHPATWRHEAAVAGLKESLRYWRSRNLRRTTGDTRPEHRGKV